MDWRAIYQSDGQGLWALFPIPLLFAAWLALRPAPAGGAEPRVAGFVHAWAIGFAVQSGLDPLATGLLPRVLGLTDSWVATALLLTFVLLGDLRVFLLVERVAAPETPTRRTLARAAAWTLVVPVVAGATHAALQAGREPLPSTAIWLLYELSFTVLALVRRAAARGAADGATAWLRAAWAYVAVYYALWATADVLILSGTDAGWALRILPNQLYYVLSVPVLWALFFSPRYAARSTSTHASR